MASPRKACSPHRKEAWLSSGALVACGLARVLATAHVSDCRTARRANKKPSFNKDYWPAQSVPSGCRERDWLKLDATRVRGQLRLQFCIADIPAAGRVWLQSPPSSEGPGTGFAGTWRCEEQSCVRTMCLLRWLEHAGEHALIGIVGNNAEEQRTEHFFPR